MLAIAFKNILINSYQVIISSSANLLGWSFKNAKAKVDPCPTHKCSEKKDTILHTVLSASV